MKQPSKRSSTSKVAAEGGGSIEGFIVVDSSEQVSEEAGAAVPRTEEIREERKTSGK